MIIIIYTHIPSIGTITIIIATLYKLTMQGTVRLFIQVEDYDPIGSNDHVADIYVTITLTPNSSFSARRAYNASDTNGNSAIELSFRVMCTSNFYGSDCATYCVARDDREGHFDCGPGGEKLCLSGWSDPSRDCTICKLYRVLSSHRHRNHGGSRGWYPPLYSGACLTLNYTH